MDEIWLKKKFRRNLTSETNRFESLVRTITMLTAYVMMRETWVGDLNDWTSLSTNERAIRSAHTLFDFPSSKSAFYLAFPRMLLFFLCIVFCCCFFALILLFIFLFHLNMSVNLYSNSCFHFVQCMWRGKFVDFSSSSSFSLSVIIWIKLWPMGEKKKRGQAQMLFQ